jgi:KipI family sensor histidine kinase inhibitor
MMLPAVTTVGDSAIEIRLPNANATATIAGVRAVADAIEAAGVPDVSDIVPAIGRVLVVYDPAGVGDVDLLLERLREVAMTVAAGTSQAPAPATHEIPVCYGGPHGPDLDDVCRLHGLSRDDLVRLHAAGDYLVEAVGFTPGFAYLRGLPERLATPRRSTPRPAVAAGSVGIGGPHTGVYPSATPGGWSIIGRSPAVLFDAARRPPALLRAGDRVRFVEITAADFSALVGSPTDGSSRAATSTAAPGLLVEDPGLSTTIQDLGRPGQRSAGVPLSGAVDTAALRLANLLVGNPETAAGLECTLTGPRLVFERDAVVALAGGNFSGLERWRPVRITAGTRLSLGHARSGCRGILAIQGGIVAPLVLGSASTYEPARLGGLSGRRLVAGDRLHVGQPSNVPPEAAAVDDGIAATLVADPPQPCILRVIPAVEAEHALRRLGEQTWRTSARSDRMGVRFEGEPLQPTTAGDVKLSASRPVLPGTLQLPPDGRPILLLADAQTMGGYPVLGHVIAADLRLAAQLRPGHPVRWEPTTLAAAHAAARARSDAWARVAGTTASPRRGQGSEGRDR